MKKIKSMLLASCVLGMVGMSSLASADSKDATAVKSAYDTVSKSYDVTVTGTAGRVIKAIDVAIWSDENGQDDIVWYSSGAVSNNQASVRFQLSKHGNRAGNYNTHVYTTYADGTRTGAVLEKSQISVIPPTVSLENNAIRIVSDVLAPSDGTVSHAVWSDENGQDDIRWYADNSSGVTLAELNNHKGYGTYHIHTYLNQNGTNYYIAANTVTLEKTEVSSQVTAVNDKTYDIVVSNVPDYISSVKIPFWSEVNGQDDIKWYTATKIGHQTYKVTVALTNHGFDYGNYTAHIYGQNVVTNTFDCLGAAPNFTVTAISGLENPSVSLSRTGNGTFTVTTLETTMSKRVTGMRVTATSTQNPSLSRTYEAKISSYGRVSQSVSLKDISNTAGNFTVTATVLYSDNSSADFRLADQSYQVETVSQTTAASPKITTYMSETNTYPTGQCTWGVKSLAPWIPNYLGNANGWATNARAKGFRTGTTPRVGAIIVWPNDGGGYGHVAYVTEVASETRIQVKEANYAGKQYIGNFRGWFNPLASYWGGNVSYIYPD